MQKRINLNGIATSPSDYDSADGSLSAAVNAEHDISSVTNATAANLIGNFRGATVLYRHKNNNYCNLIVKNDDGNYYWCSESDIPSSFNTEGESEKHTITVSPSFILTDYKGNPLRFVSDGETLSAIDPTEVDGGTITIIPGIIIYIDGKDASNESTYEFVSEKKYLNRSASTFIINDQDDYAGSYNYVYKFNAFGKEFTVASGFCISNGPLLCSIEEVESDDDSSSSSSSSSTDSDEPVVIQPFLLSLSSVSKYDSILSYSSGATIEYREISETGWTELSYTSGTITLLEGTYIFRSLVNNEYTTYSVLVLSGRTYTYEEPTELSTDFPYTDGGYPYSLTEYIPNPNLFSELVNASVSGVIALGNSLIVNAGSEKYYYLFSETNNVYNYLGTHLPELELSFGLQTYVDAYQTYENEGRIARTIGTGAINENYLVNKVKLSKNVTPYNFKDISEEDITNVSDAVLGAVNKFVAEECEEAGKFGMPFLVRFAYRLYDDSLSMHSIPVLMIPANFAPFVPVIRVNSNTDTIYFCVVGTTADLDFRIISDSIISEIRSKWSDIIRSIDIFVSAPFCLYKQDGEVKDIACSVSIKGSSSGTRTTVSSDYANADYIMIGKNNNCFVNTKTICYSDKYTVVPVQSVFPEVYELYLDDSTLSNTTAFNFYQAKLQLFAAMSPCRFVLPTLSNDDINQQIRDCSTFYLLKSYSINDKVLNESNTAIKIDIPEYYLSSLNTREVMDDEYQSHDIRMSTGMTTYNNRLIEFGTSRYLYSGFSPLTMLQYQEPIDSTPNKDIYLGFKVIENGVENYIKSATASYPLNSRINYIYYPNDSVKYANVFFGDMACRLDSNPHSFLNGTVYTDLFNNIENTSAPVESATNNAITNYNALYTSNITNPFVFKASNVETVGNGRIIALVPQAIALSEGQFGEYPMMCFTTDGIWALSVNDTGGWSAKQPFSRDVVLNEDAGNILQLDRQVMFATNRGLMLISGSSVECISENFDGPADSFSLHVSSSQQLAGYDFIKDYVLTHTDILTTRTDITDPSHICPDFQQFIGNAVFLYDYTHQRIIIGNEDYPTSFVFNMKDKAWTAISQRITSSVNSYPNCYAMTKDASGSNLLVDFAATDGSASDVCLPSDGFILTRPLKLDAPDLLKTVSLIVARGKMSASSVDLVLLASRNLTDWVLVKSVKGNRLSLLHGTPYKYFRVGIITHLQDGEYLSSLDIEYDTKQTNKIR